MRLDLADADHVPELRQAITQFGEFWQRAIVDDGDVRASIGETEFKRVGAEQMRQGNRYRAHLVDRHMGDCRLRALRQNDRHTITAQRTEGSKHIGKTIGLALDIPEGMRRGEAALVLEIQGKTAAIFGPATTDVDADIEARWHLPAKIRTQRSVAARFGIQLNRHLRLPVVQGL